MPAFRDSSLHPICKSPVDLVKRDRGSDACNIRLCLLSRVQLRVTPRRHLQHFQSVPKPFLEHVFFGALRTKLVVPICLTADSHFVFLLHAMINFFATTESERVDIVSTSVKTQLLDQSLRGCIVKWLLLAIFKRHTFFDGPLGALSAKTVHCCLTWC